VAKLSNTSLNVQLPPRSAPLQKHHVHLIAAAPPPLPARAGDTVAAVTSTAVINRFIVCALRPPIWRAALSTSGAATGDRDAGFR
jgi:hypothetical protein